MTLLATQNSNLSQNSPPSWLIEIHSKLWKRPDLFDQIFRTATLTENHFLELQHQLDKLNPERMEESYVAKDVLATKSAFLQAKSTPLKADVQLDGLVPRLVFDASSHLLMLWTTTVTTT